MAHKYKEGKPLPKIVQLEQTDTKEVMLLKSCIFRMTTFHSIDRASIQEVCMMMEGRCSVHVSYKMCFGKKKERVNVYV